MKNILLTGSSGFLGKIIIEVLSSEYKIVAINREHFDFLSSNKILLQENPELIIHCAGKAHLDSRSKVDETLFFNTNLEGTKRFLNAIENGGYYPKYFVFISSVSVYGLIKGRNISEENSLNAKDPYGKSKVLSEEFIQNWCASKDIKLTILRLPLLVGKNPKGNLSSMIMGIKKGYYINIDNGRAKKSMVLAEDVASFIPKVALIGGIFNLTDGCHPSFFELSQHIAKCLGKKTPINISKYIMFIFAMVGDILGIRFFYSEKLKKLINDLTFDDAKARKQANWNPTPVLEGFKLNLICFFYLLF